MKPWHYADLQAPSRAVERDAVPDTLAVLNVPTDCWATLDSAIRAGDGGRVIMTPNGGWGAGAQYEAGMLMSFYTDRDHAVTVYADPAAVGALYRATCDDETYHIAHWSACGNLARLTLSDAPQATIPLSAHREPVSVSEPSTALLLALGAVVLWRWL